MKQGKLKRPRFIFAISRWLRVHLRDPDRFMGFNFPRVPKKLNGKIDIERGFFVPCPATVLF